MASFHYVGGGVAVGADITEVDYDHLAWPWPHRMRAWPETLNVLFVLLPTFSLLCQPN